MEVLKKQEDFYYKDELITFLGLTGTLRWLNEFPVLYLICQGFWMADGHKGYLADPRKFHQAAIRYPDWYFAFCYESFGDAEWIYMFEHHPNLIKGSDVETICPEVFEKFKDRLHDED